jgi:hypothetical protein
MVYITPQKNQFIGELLYIYQQEIAEKSFNLSEAVTTFIKDNHAHWLIDIIQAAQELPEIKDDPMLRAYSDGEITCDRDAGDRAYSQNLALYPPISTIRFYLIRDTLLTPDEY